MNKILTLTSLTFIFVALTACGTSAQAASDRLSFIIQDPQLQQGWELLNQHTELIQLPDGRSLSGHTLAQFVLENGIPVQWDAQNICKGSSCSKKYCADGVCDYEDGLPGVDPIYLNASIRDLGGERMSRTVESMAHEIFHRMQPFGLGKTTLFEEFNAYFLSTRISGAAWTGFEGYDPLKSACLQRWFADRNLLYGYTDLELYPQDDGLTVDISLNTCPLPGEPMIEQTAQTMPTSPAAENTMMVCEANQLGLVVCEQIVLDQPIETQAMSELP